MSKSYLHSEVASLDVRYAFCSWGKAGRVISGLLKSAAKRGDICVEFHCGRVSGSQTFYVMSDEQLAAIRAKAISRGDRKQTLREQICTPVSVDVAAQFLIS